MRSLEPTLIKPKLSRPAVPGDLIVRPRLAGHLSRALSGQLTLVCAGAGFGKTTLVSSWAEQMLAGGESDAAPPVAWLSLDEADSDLIVFLRYFVAALRTVFPEACPETEGLLKASRRTPLAHLGATLANEIALLPRRFVLVLDDYQAVRAEAVHDLLNGLVRHWPRPLHLVLISRIDPPLPLASLRANRRITEIRSHDLRFTPEEAAAYLTRELPAPLGERALSRLQERTEGWIAGLRLAALSLAAAGDPESAAAMLSGADADIADYLADEVLSRQSPAVQTFLLKTSVLDHLCAALCDAVAPSEDPKWNARACLDWLVRANLFVISLDNRREWYRYHDLFRDVLQQRLRVVLGAGEVTDLHCRAAAWYAERGLVDEALRHALAGQDLNLAARLVEHGLRDVLNREDRPMLERWLERLPEDLIQRRPGLLMARAWSLQFSWQLDAVSKVLKQVEALMDEDGGGSPPSDGFDDPRVLRGEIAVLRGQEAYFANLPAHAIAFCQEALALLPTSWAYCRGGAMFYLGMAMQASGQGEAAERLLLDHYAPLADATGAFSLRLLFALCFNHLHAGNLERTRLLAQEMLQLAARRRLAIMQGWANYFLGLVHYHWNDLDVARQHFAEIVANRYAAHSSASTEAIIGLALIHQIRGQSSEAWQVLELLSQFDLEQRGFEGDRTRALRARLMLMQGKVESASRWADAFTGPVPDRRLIWMEEPQVTRARVLVARGGDADLESALHILDTLHESAERTFNTRYRIEILALRALALDAQGESGDAASALQQAIGLSRPGGFIRVFVDQGPRMREMLSRLGRQRSWAEITRRLLAAFPDKGFIMVGGDKQPQPVQSSPLNAPAVVETLTPRELDVLMLLQERLSNKEIAHVLVLSPSTVKRHTANIYGKLGVNNRREAVATARVSGILRDG